MLPSHTLPADAGAKGDGGDGGVAAMTQVAAVKEVVDTFFLGSSKARTR